MRRIYNIHNLFLAEISSIHRITNGKIIYLQQYTQINKVFFIVIILYYYADLGFIIEFKLNTPIAVIYSTYTSFDSCYNIEQSYHLLIFYILLFVVSYMFPSTLRFQFRILNFHTTHSDIILRVMYFKTFHKHRYIL